jgi:hypothetical protein
VGLLSKKLARLVTMHATLYDNRVGWIKLEGIEGVIYWVFMCLCTQHSHGA